MKTGLILVCLLLSSCLNVVHNSCVDGVRNGDESAIDCGGSCAACANGQSCFSNFDCLSGFCNNRICSSTNSCRDGTRNGNESDVDCGGSCPACPTGYACLSSFDCQSGFCNGRICATATPTCTDGVQNGTETDVDCGGSCPACLPGRFCATGADCTSGLCQAQRCAMPTSSSLPPVPAGAVYLVDPGASVIVDPGVQAGYGITANVGSSFRLIWVGDGGSSGSYRQFYGSVWTTGRILSSTPGCAQSACPLESADGDYVSPPYQVQGGQRIDFDSFAFNSIDGFDFVVDTEPAYFDLYIDGQRYPNLVFFTSGGQQAITGALPFGLRTQ